MPEAIVGEMTDCLAGDWVRSDDAHWRRRLAEAVLDEGSLAAVAAECPHPLPMYAVLRALVRKAPPQTARQARKACLRAFADVKRRDWAGLARDVEALRSIVGTAPSVEDLAGLCPRPRPRPLPAPRRSLWQRLFHPFRTLRDKHGPNKGDAR